MGCCNSTPQVLYDPNKLPTVLERTLVNEQSRVKFEEHIQGTEGEILLLIYKPLIYFETQALQFPKCATTMGDIFKKLYILPHLGRISEGEHIGLFSEFVDTQKVKAFNFYILRENLDRTISIKYLVPYRKENGDDLGASDTAVYQELNIANESSQIMSTKLKRTRKNKKNKNAQEAFSL